MAEIALGVVTPSCAQVKFTVIAAAETGTETLEPQVAAVQVPQLFGLPAESRAGFIVLGVETENEMLPVVAGLTAGPALPDTVNDMPV
jgi:hypothetical protein